MDVPSSLEFDHHLIIFDNAIFDIDKFDHYLIIFDNASFRTIAGIN